MTFFVSGQELLVLLVPPDPADPRVWVGGLAVLELIFAFLRKRLQIVKNILKGVSWVPHVSLDDLIALNLVNQVLALSNLILVRHTMIGQGSDQDKIKKGVGSWGQDTTSAQKTKSITIFLR